MKRFGLLLFGVLAAMSCGGDGGNGPPTITAVVVSSDSTVVLAGTRQLTATAMAGGSSITNGVTFQWTSSDTTLATVGPTGLVSGRARGTVTITALAVLNGTPTSVSGGRGLRVRIGSIAITPGTPQFASLHDSVAVTGSARDALNGVVPGVRLVWQSRNAPVASIADSGVGGQVFVVAQTNGTARIVVTGDGVSDSVTATVQQVAVSLSVSPDTARFDRLGAAVTPTLTGADARGNPVAASAVNWTSQATGIATVATTGIITSKGAGTTRVIATSGAVADTVHVLVEQVPARVKLHPQTVDTSRILVAGTMQFIDSVFDANDSLIRSPAPSVTWSSSAAVASVDTAGVVTGASLGSAFIKAVSGMGQDSVRIEVVGAAITLSGQVQPILNVAPGVCSSCHFPGGAAGLNLTAGSSFANLVGHSSGESALKRVLQFRPDSSYLVHKIQGTHLVPPASGSGARMPFQCTGSGCLSKAQINVIRNWILQGALEN
jgi:uncharacterized protein YjdB